MSTDVDSYIQKQPQPQGEIVAKLRALIHAQYPDIPEEMKMGVPWYGGKFYLVGLKDHVNMGFCLGDKALESQLDVIGKQTGHLEFRTVEDVDEAKLTKLMDLAYKHPNVC